MNRETIKIIFFLILIFLMKPFKISEAVEEKLFDISIEVAANKIVLGEPIIVYGIVKYIGENKIYISKYTKHGIEVKDKCDAIRYWVTHKDEIIKWELKEEISPGWKLIETENLAWCIIKPRKLEVRYHYYFEPPVEAKNISKEVWIGHVVSEWKEIDISYPRGEDEIAFKSILGDNPSAKDLNEWIRLKNDEILQKYPTSTYAGWALLSNKAEIGRPEDAIPPPFAFFYFPEPYESRMKRSRDNWPSLQKEYIEKLENYLRSRPDFPLKEIMLYKIAYQYAYFMKYDKAKDIANSLVKEGKNQKVVEYSKRLINLIETGYYQNKIEERKKQLQKDYWEKKK